MNIKTGSRRGRKKKSRPKPPPRASPHTHTHKNQMVGYRPHPTPPSRISFKNSPYGKKRQKYFPYFGVCLLQINNIFVNHVTHMHNVLYEYYVYADIVVLTQSLFNRPFSHCYLPYRALFNSKIDYSQSNRPGYYCGGGEI